MAAAMAGGDLERALRRAWFPVLRAEDLGGPRMVTLLGEELVVFRTAAGAPAVASNRCPHRGAGLALGEVHGDAIACPYHGWQWRAGDGGCTRIPSLADQSTIPRNFRLRTYPAEERLGLIWTCLDEPLSGLPWPSELDADEWALGCGEPIPAPVGIAAATENFRDVAHFPFVHRVSMGEVREAVDRLDVRRDGTEVWLDWPFPASSGAGSVWDREAPVIFRYHLVAPSFVSLVMDYGAGGKRVLINAPSPHDRESCTIFWVEGVTADFDGPSLQECIDITSRVYAEDNPILATLRPREVPFGTTPEFSTASDRYTLAYRRAFLEFVSRANGEVPAGAGVAGSPAAGGG
jgi:phenylpropionate dioxygenase-like ring-hydroxylating dioxygenase large terminal subunit